MLVVGVGRTEAKVEGLFSEVCRLDYKGNVLDSMGGEVLKGAPCHVMLMEGGVLPYFCFLWQAEWSENRSACVVPVSPSASSASSRCFESVYMK